MDPDHLESFLAVARAGSVNRAAGALHRSQPNVTRHIQLLERDLQTVLFERASTGMRLSVTGRALLPIAESIVAAQADAHRAVRDAAGDPAGTIRLAAVGTLADDNLVRALGSFRRAFPAADVRIRTALSAAVSAMVRAGDADLGLRYGFDDDPLLACTRAVDEPIIAIAGPDHPLAKRRRPTVVALRPGPWFTFASINQPVEEPYTDALRSTFARLGVSPNDLSVIDSLSAQKVLVRAGLGLALVPQSSARPELDDGRLVSVRLPFAARPAAVVLVRRRHAIVTRVEQALIDAITEATAAP